METEYINIKVLAKESESRLLRKLPDFAYFLLEKIIQQDRMNEILDKYADCNGPDFLERVLGDMNIRINAEGLDNLPQHSRCIFVANHPFGIADGLILTYIVSQKYGSLKAIGNNAFQLIPQLKPIITAVNVFGKNSRDYLKEIENVYNSDVAITHFPAGLVSRNRRLNVIDREWQKSFITKAVEHQRDIVPIYFEGTNSWLFYTIHSIRSLLGIKTNYELMLIPREFFNKQNKLINVKIGKPVPYATFDKSKTHVQWAQWMKESLYALRKN
jgi:putative hemolysin